MRDTLLWTWLTETPLREDALTAELVASASSSLDSRVPLFGLVEPLLAHPSPNLRAAALAFLRGAAGFPAARALVHAVHSSNVTVVHRAALSLAAAAAQDHAHFWHLLFHPQQHVRRDALLNAPPSIPSHHFLLLLADETLQATVLQRFAGTGLEPTSIQLLLATCRSGVLPKTVMSRCLDALAWHRNGGVLLSKMPTVDVPNDVINRHEKLRAFLTATVNSDPLDVFMRVVLPDAGGMMEQLRLGVTSRMLGEKIHRRIAASILRTGYETGNFPPLPLALAMSAMSCVLELEDIGLEERRRAAELLGNTVGAARCADPLGRIRSHPILRSVTGEVHLKVALGVLHLAENHPFKKLLQHIPLEEVVHAFWRDPSGSMGLLSRPPVGTQDVEAYTSIVDGLFAQPRPGMAAVVAESLLHLAQDGTSKQILLDRVGITTLNVTEAFLALPPQLWDRAPEHRQARAAAIVARKLAVTDAEPPLQLVLSRMQDNGPGRQLLLRLCERLPERQLVAMTTALPPALLSRFVGLLTNWTEFPLEKEHALARELAGHGDAVVGAWAACARRPQPPAPETLARAQTGDTRTLTAEETAAIRDATHAQLPAALEVSFTSRVRGVSYALVSRQTFPPNADACAAMLNSHDAPLETALGFRVFAPDDPEFMQQVHERIVARCEFTPGMPLLGSAWMSLWDVHHEVFMEQALAVPGGLRGVLDLSLTLGVPMLSFQLWRAVTLTFERWRQRAPERIRSHATEHLMERMLDVLDVTHPIHGELARPGHPPNERWIVEFQTCAANFFVAVHESQHIAEELTVLEPLLTPMLPGLTSDILERLARWVNVKGVTPRVPGSLVSLAADSDVVLAAVRNARQLDELLVFCRFPDSTVVQEAVRLVLERGEAGQSALLAMLASRPPPHHRLIAASVTLWTEGDALAAARALARDSAVDAEIRFCVGLALVARGEVAAAHSLFEAARETHINAWFSRGDYDALLDAGLDSLGVALQLASAPHYHAYTRAVAFLCLRPRTNKDVHAALRAFLLAGDERLASLRIDAANRLRAAGDLVGMPVLFRAMMDTESSVKDLLMGVPLQVGEALTRSVLLAGPITRMDAWLDCLGFPGISPAVQAACAAHVLKDTSSTDAQAVVMPMVKHGLRRDEKLQRLARAFAWGIQQGRALTGRLFSVELVGGTALGYTRLDESRVFINPLPLLRNEPNGDDVVRALILHELGHHMFHAGPENLAVWKTAQAERLHQVLNLIADEHLERNLRAGSETHGNALKHLAAYAFQHTHRSIAVESLVRMLGVRCFSLLSNVVMKPSRIPGQIILPLGHVLHALEAAGMSFPRFVRALRMGMGNRHKDPRVEEALKLFRKDLRKLTMPEMLERARAVRAIFHDEMELMELMDLHDSMDGPEQDLNEQGDGIGQGELQEEIDKILNPRKKTGKLTRDEQIKLNRTSGEEFKPITHVQVIPPDAVAHRAQAAPVASISRRMRVFFSSLGLSMVPQRQRTQGRVFDRTRALAAATRNDPRVLISRRIQRSADLFLGVLVDCSGSMAVHDNIGKARTFAVMLAEAARGLPGLDFRVWGFTDTVIYDAGSAASCAATQLTAGGGNNDAAALWHAAQVALRSERSARLLVMISDGAPTDCSVAALKALVTRLHRRHHVQCAQVAVRPLQEICFPHYVELQSADLAASTRMFGNIIARLVGRTLQGG